MLFVETRIFTRQLLAFLSDEEYRELQGQLLERPDLGALIPGSGGLRKARWGVGARGKRGGARVIYYWLRRRDTILMLLIYPKNVQDDLTPEQLRLLRRTVEDFLP